MPDHGADVTTRFLKSNDGVWQAIHLGKDEMANIAEDKFSKDLWDVTEKTRNDAPKFFFLFGKADHWVANEIRDEFIRQREEYAHQDGPGKGRTGFEIDEEVRISQQQLLDEIEHFQLIWN